MCDFTYLFVVIVCVRGSSYSTLFVPLFANFIAIRLAVFGVAGTTELGGGSGELRRILWSDLGCVYGVCRLMLRGDALFETCDEKAYILLEPPAECGGVNVKVGLSLGRAELGVSGYDIANGPGVAVRSDGCIYPSSALIFV